jgi:hypothetical protein
LVDEDVRTNVVVFLCIPKGILPIQVARANDDTDSRSSLQLLFNDLLALIAALMPRATPHL